MSGSSSAVAAVAAAGSVVAVGAALARSGGRRSTRPHLVWPPGLGPPLRWHRHRASVGPQRQAFEHVQASLRSGWSMLGALGRLADTEEPWAAGAARAVREIERGATVAAAIDRWAVDAGTPDAVAFADAVAVAGATGASQAQAVGTALAVIDERRALEQELWAATAQHRASAVALVAVPIGFALAVGVADPRVGAFYVADPRGWACVVVGLALDLAAAAWFRHLMRSAR